MRSNRLVSLVLIGSVATAAVGAGAASAGTYETKATKSATAAIKGFGPKKITVKRGDTVSFRNTDAAAHNAVATRKIGKGPAFNSGTPTKGNFSIRAPRKKGTYAFVCAVHPLTMKGRLVVK